MAILVKDEIDFLADSRIKQVYLGMSFQSRNLGSLSTARQSLMAGSLVASRVLTIETIECSLHWGRNGSLRTSGWYMAANVQHRGKLSHFFMNFVSFCWIETRSQPLVESKERGLGSFLVSRF